MTRDDSSALALVAHAAPTLDGQTSSTASGELRLQLPVPLVDGRRGLYTILVANSKDGLKAREEPPGHLPAFCPERHINGDGTFCLYWREGEAIEVKDQASAIVWLETLFAFLKTQSRAARKKRWPGASWAHGEAARYQALALRAARDLGADFQSALSAQRLTVKRGIPSGSNGPCLRLYCDGVHLFTVWERSSKLANRKQRCACKRADLGGRRRIKACFNHESAARDLVLGLWLWTHLEEKYWRELKRAGAKCCGTMHGCPLAPPTVAANAAAA